MKHLATVRIDLANALKLTRVVVATGLFTLLAQSSARADGNSEYQFGIELEKPADDPALWEQNRRVSLGATARATPPRRPARSGQRDRAPVLRRPDHPGRSRPRRSGDRIFSSRLETRDLPEQAGHRVHGIAARQARRKVRLRRVADGAVDSVRPLRQQRVLSGARRKEAGPHSCQHRRQRKNSRCWQRRRAGGAARDSDSVRDRRVRGSRPRQQKTRCVVGPPDGIVPGRPRACSGLVAERPRRPQPRPSQLVCRHRALRRAVPAQSRRRASRCQRPAARRVVRQRLAFRSGRRQTVRTGRRLHGQSA